MRPSSTKMGVSSKQTADGTLVAPSLSTPMTIINEEVTIIDHPVTATPTATAPAVMDVTEGASSGSDSPTTSDTPPTSPDTGNSSDLDDDPPKTKDKGKAKAIRVVDDETDSAPASPAWSERYGDDDPFMLDDLEAAIIESHRSALTEPKLGESSRNNSISTDSSSSGSPTTINSIGSGTLSTSPDQAYAEFWPRGSAQSAARALVRLADADYNILETDLEADTQSSPPSHPSPHPYSNEPFLFANPGPPDLTDLLAQAQSDSIEPSSTEATRAPSPMPSESVFNQPPVSAITASDAFIPLYEDSFPTTYEPFRLSAQRAFASRDGGGDAESDLPSLTRSSNETLLTWRGSEYTDSVDSSPSLTFTVREMVETRAPFVDRPPSVASATSATGQLVMPDAPTATLPTMQQLRCLDIGDDGMSTRHWDKEHWEQRSRNFESPDPFVEENEEPVASEAGDAATEVSAQSTAQEVAQELLIQAMQTAEEQDIADISLALDDMNPFSATPITAEAQAEATESTEIADVSLSLDAPPAGATAPTAMLIGRIPAIAPAEYPVVRLRRGVLPIRRHALRVADIETARAERAAATAAGTNEAASSPEVPDVTVATDSVTAVASLVDGIVARAAAASAALTPCPIPPYYPAPSPPPITPTPPNTPVNDSTSPSGPVMLSLHAALGLTLGTFRGLRGLRSRAARFWRGFLNFRLESEGGQPPALAVIVLMTLLALCVPLMSRYFPFDESMAEIWRRRFGRQ